MGYFIEIKEHTYQDLTLKFLSTLHVEVIRGSQYQVGYISFYLQGQSYELNLGTFNCIFGFPPSMDLPNRQVPCEFNSNAIYGELLGSVRYNTNSSKCTHIRNPCIRVVQRILACCFFGPDDSLNVSRFSKLYFLSCALDGVQLDPSSFLAMQLYSSAVSTKGMMVIGGIVTTIARFLGIDPNPKDRVSGSEWLDQTVFGSMNFCKVDARRSYWFYPGDVYKRAPNDQAKYF